MYKKLIIFGLLVIHAQAVDAFSWRGWLMPKKQTKKLFTSISPKTALICTASIGLIGYILYKTIKKQKDSAASLSSIPALDLSSINTASSSTTAIPQKQPRNLLQGLLNAFRGVKNNLLKTSKTTINDQREQFSKDSYIDPYNEEMNSSSSTLPPKQARSIKFINCSIGNKVTDPYNEMDDNRGTPNS